MLRTFQMPLVHIETVNNCLIKNEMFIICTVDANEHFAIHTANSCSGCESLEAGFYLTSQRFCFLKSYQSSTYDFNFVLHSVCVRHVQILDQIFEQLCLRVISL